jgi:3-oxoadipate enol-lactonase
VLAPQTYMRQPLLVERVKAIMASTPVSGIVGDLMALAERPNSLPLLPSINVPTLVVVGAHDQLTTPSDAERIASGIRRARLVTIPDAGHLSNMEQPVLFNRAVEEFALGLPGNPI